MLPILLDLRDRLTVVVGAGVVGMRKVRAVRAAGGRVRVVCREPAPADWADPAVDWLTAEYATPHLHGAGLVFACGPAALNRRVAADARALGVLLCEADDPLAGDFSLPAIHRLGRLTLTVSTGGAAPGLAVWLRDQLAEQLDPKLADWLDGLAECRAVLAECPDADGPPPGDGPANRPGLAGASARRASPARARRDAGPGAVYCRRNCLKAIRSWV
jgi:siroheme synthase-like protein